ncbi:hypothetical protein SAMN05421841_3464 [Chryseobacterium wanjuense]|uniref:Regulatory protein, luxR family n=1 Tax=Chryseobacterium wanjuense TaxID=356305 RepID=A0A1I0RZH6_9FLAO|nr:hypothetical protein [Chryseobacterium wanjuense]SEW47210.1 hypothetical protein SAMN05421841_3464 [Chryseobacterium wanjuense]
MGKTKFIRTLCTLHFLFVFFQVHAQNTIPEIDSLQKNEAKRLQDIGNLRGKILLEKSLFRQSKKLKYKKGELRACIGIASTLCGLSRHKESFQLLEYSSRELRNFDDAELKTKLNIVYGRNYYSLGMYKKAVKSFNEGVKNACEIEDTKNRKKQLFYIYEWKRSSFSMMGMSDSAKIMERKCMESPIPMLFIEIAQRHMMSGQIDSAEFYLGKAAVLAQDASAESKSNVLRGYGELYMKTEDYDKALTSLFSSLSISQKAGLKSRDRETYKLIAQVYNRLHHIEKENEYLQKYSTLNDSLIENEKSALDIPIEILLNQTGEKGIKNNTIPPNYIVLLLAGFTGILLTYAIYSKKQKSKNKIIREEALPINDDNKKPDISLNEVVQLAINGDPTFIIVFKDFYSDFYTTLTSKHPELTLNDLRFIAMVKLNFSNKEIAQYGNMSIRTVESKKYRLRKKLDLPADLDFNQWVLGQ